MKYKTKNFLNLIGKNKKIYIGIFILTTLIILSFGIPIFSDIEVGGCGGSSNSVVTARTDGDKSARINMKFSLIGNDDEEYRINVIVENSGDNAVVANLDNITVEDGAGTASVELLLGKSYNFIANILDANGNIVASGREDNLLINLQEQTVLININFEGSDVFVDLQFVTKIISPNKEARLDSPSSSVRVNPDTFIEEISLGLNEEVVEIEETENPISPVVTLAFSDVVLARNPIRVEISPNADELEHGDIIAMAQTNGEDVTIGHVEKGIWIPTVPTFNQQTNRYEINIHATASRLSLVLVRKDGIVKLRIEAEEINGGNNNAKAFKKGNKQKSNKAMKMLVAGDNNWGNRGWNIRCKFNDPNDNARFCNEDDENSPIKLLKSSLIEVTRKLINDYGMVEAKLETEIIDGNKYNLVFLGDNTSCGEDNGRVKGCYYYQTSTLLFLKRLLNEDSDYIKFIVAHELTHAVQAAKAPNIYSTGLTASPWILEGLSDHAGASTIGRNIANNPMKERKDWSNPLTSASYGLDALDVNEYQAGEFWAMILNPDQIYPFLSDLGETGALARVNSYQAVSNVFEGVWNMSLDDLYLEYVSAYHSVDLNYPYCTEYSPADLTDTFTIHGANLKPLSAHCYKVFHDPDRKVTIEADVPNGRLLPFALVVNGNKLQFNGGDTASTGEIPGFDYHIIWIFNLYMPSNAGIDIGVNYEIRIKPKKPRCDFTAECAVTEDGSGCTVYLLRPSCDSGRDVGIPDCAQLDEVFNILSEQASTNFEQHVEELAQECDAYNRRQEEKEAYLKCKRETPRADCGDLPDSALDIMGNPCSLPPTGIAWREFTNEDIDCPALDDICENPAFGLCD